MAVATNLKMYLEDVGWWRAEARGQVKGTAA